MSINKKAVIEHIARATNKDISYIEKAVNVEYWKDIVDFASFRGIDLFADYLRSQDIKEIRGMDRLIVEVPIYRFQEELSQTRTATFCIYLSYSRQFRCKYADEFTFIP